jgi:hypothetical protein
MHSKERSKESRPATKEMKLVNAREYSPKEFRGSEAEVKQFFMTSAYRASKGSRPQSGSHK